jgi:hypothetical protein
MDRVGAWILAAVLSAAGCSGLIAKATPPALPGSPAGALAGVSDETVMPSLVGMTREQAAALVRSAGFRHDLESSTPLECEGGPRVEGLVGCQRPPAGALVKKYTLVQVSVHRAGRVAGAIVRSQLLSLIGKEPEEARSALASYGHDGEVKVEPARRHHDGCGENRVCAFDVPESGMGASDPITLFVNPGLQIAMPPP